jgi:hypothetical protein
MFSVTVTSVGCVQNSQGQGNSLGAATAPTTGKTSLVLTPEAPAAALLFRPGARKPKLDLDLRQARSSGCKARWRTPNQAPDSPGGVITRLSNPLPHKHKCSFQGEYDIG